MKNILVAILAFLYLGVSSGIAMEIHYCMGKKAGIEFYGSSDDTCGNCGMTEKKSGCCSDEHKFFKLNDSHKNVSNNLSFEMPVAIIAKTFVDKNWLTVNDPFTLEATNHSPPIFTGPALCIMNSIFRL